MFSCRRSIRRTDDEAHALGGFCRSSPTPGTSGLTAGPLFLVYRPAASARSQAVDRRVAERLASSEAPLSLYLLGIDSHCRGTDCRELGFDGTCASSRNSGALEGRSLMYQALGRLGRNLRRGVPSASLKVYDYEEARRLMNHDQPEFPNLPVHFRGLGQHAKTRKPGHHRCQQHSGAIRCRLLQASRTLCGGVRSTKSSSSSMPGTSRPRGTTLNPTTGTR